MFLLKKALLRLFLSGDILGYRHRTYRHTIFVKHIGIIDFFPVIRPIGCTNANNRFGSSLPLMQLCVQSRIFFCIIRVDSTVFDYAFRHIGYNHPYTESCIRLFSLQNAAGGQIVFPHIDFCLGNGDLKTLFTPLQLFFKAFSLIDIDHHTAEHKSVLGCGQAGARMQPGNLSVPADNPIFQSQ